MFRATKPLKEAVAQHTGCEADELQILEVEPSAAFTPRDRHGRLLVQASEATTTWIEFLPEETGELTTTTLEEVLNLPTTYVIPGDRHGDISADAEAFKLAEMYGRGSYDRPLKRADVYPECMPGSIEDRDEGERLKRALARMIRANAVKMMQQEQADSRAAAKRARRSWLYDPAAEQRANSEAA